MNNLYIKLVFRFIFYLLFQVLVLNNIELNGLMNPYYYPLFILLLPISFPNWLALLLAFVLGISVGSFSNSIGLHSLSLVLMTFVRTYVIQIIFPQSKAEEMDEFSIGKIGAFTFTLYTFILIFIHHFVFFTTEVMSFSRFYLTISKIVLSSILSTSLIILGEYLFWRKASR
jgi:rod shape-determining protein MreD